MREKVVFLDRDGTINEDKGYTFKVEDYKLLPGVKRSLKKLTKAGFELFILTNQSGIGLRKYGEAHLKAYMTTMMSDLRSCGVEIKGYYFCPHTKNSGCACRKPKPGLIIQAEHDHGPFDFNKTWIVGDSERDVEMASNYKTGIRSILLNKKPVGNTAGNFIADNILEATKIIIMNTDEK